MNIFKKLVATGICVFGFSVAQAATVVDFEGVDLGGAHQQEFSSLTIGDITFTGTEGHIASHFDIENTHAGNYGTTGQYLTNGSHRYLAIMMEFANPVESIGFNIGHSTNDWIFEVFDSGMNSLGSLGLVPTGNHHLDFSYFEIVASNISFARLTDVEVHNAQDQIYLDNFTFTSAVPEPTVYALMLGGLGLVGFMANRRRKQA